MFWQIALGQIEWVEITKYWGIIINDRLHFKCTVIIRKSLWLYVKRIGKKISFLNRIDNFVYVNIRCIIYKSIIAPQFEHYAIHLIIKMDEAQFSIL